MRFVWILVASLAACGGAPRPLEPAPIATPSEPAPCVATAPPPAQLDEAMLVERSKALYDAIDGNDVTTFLKMVGPSFAMFEQARSYSATMMLQQMSGRAERGAKRQRTWKDVRVDLGPNVAVFVGDAMEQLPGEGGKVTEWEGWNTLVWVHDGGEWKAAHAQWQPAGLEAERAMWNEAFRKSISFKTGPNQLLVDTVKTLKKGTALDLAMGQGRNAVFLASKGWKVTGVDISDEGLRQAKDAAQKARVKIDAVLADVDKYDLGTSKWDLVAMIYAGSDATQVEKIKAALKKGGVVVVEYFHSEATSGVGIGGFASGELAAKFEGWKVLRDDTVEDVADWSLRKVKLVRFVAQKP